MMKKLFISILLAGLIIGGGSVFAADTETSGQTNTGTSGQTHMKSSTTTTHTTTTEETTGPNMIRGEITSINGNTVMVRDRMGGIHSVMVTDPNTLSGLNVGDNVEVRFLSASISKITGTPQENAPNMGPNESSQPLSNPPNSETQEGSQGTK